MESGAATTPAGPLRTRSPGWPGRARARKCACVSAPLTGWQEGLDRGLGNEVVESAVRACHHRCETPVHLLRRNIGEKMADIPAVAGRVTRPARPLAIKLSFRFAFDLGARLGRAANHRLSIVELQSHRNRGAAQGQRSQKPGRKVIVG